MADLRTPREQHDPGGIEAIAPQVHDPRQHLEPIHARLPSFARLHADAGAMPGDFDVARNGREQDLARQTARPAAAAAGHLVDHFVELNDEVAIEFGDDSAGFRLDVDDFRRRGVGRPARRLTQTRARAPRKQRGEQAR